MYAVALFAAGGFPGQAFLGAVLVLGFAACGMPAAWLARGIRPVLLLMALALAVQLFFHGGEELARWGPVALYREGLKEGALIAARLMLLVLSGMLLAYSTPPVLLADAIGRLLSPLAALRLPVHELALMMTIALRFIPTLANDFERVIRAQAARGGAAGRGGLLRRWRQVFPVLVPLLVMSFRHADELALAMEARCWRGGRGRTQWRRLKFNFSDAVFALVAVIFIAAGIAAGRLDLW